MVISLVLAIAENDVIGRDGTIPWHLPDDLERFKAITMGHTIVMGRKTFEAIGKPLPNRRNVVLTRNRDFEGMDLTVFHEFEAALSSAAGEEEVFVIGGAEVFSEALPRAGRVYMTAVHAEIEGDTKFSEFEESGWELLEDQFHDSDEKHQHPFSFRIYERAHKRKGPAPQSRGTGPNTCC